MIFSILTKVLLSLILITPTTSITPKMKKQKDYLVPTTEGRTCQDDGYPAGYYWSDEAQQCLAPQGSVSSKQSNSENNYHTASTGTIKIGRYSANVYWGTYDSAIDQQIVDNKNSAVMFYWQNHLVVGDHAHQGFRVVKNSKIGTQAYLDGRKIQLVSKYQGYNDGSLNANDIGGIENIQDGEICMYTCNDRTGYSITLTFWTYVD